MGQVLQAGAGQAPARQAAVGAGLPIETPADTINKVCASSIRAVEIADSMIRAGDASSSSPAGWSRCRTRRTLLAQARFGYRLGDGDADRPDGPRRARLDLRRPAHGRAGSFVARELGISREEQDAWAFRSHARAAAAQDAGRFADEIVPVGEVDGRREPAPRHVAREARGAQAGLRPRRDDDRRQRARRQRRRVVRGRLRARSGRAARDRAAGDDRRPGLRRRRVRLPRPDAGEGGGDGARAAPARRSTTSQRVEINEAFSSVARALDAAARRRRGARQRERRRGRARPSDRRLGRPDPRDARPRAAPRAAAGSGSRRSAPAAARATRC